MPQKICSSNSGRWQNFTIRIRAQWLDDAHAYDAVLPGKLSKCPAFHLVNNCIMASQVYQHTCSPYVCTTNGPEHICQWLKVISSPNTSHFVDGVCKCVTEALIWGKNKSPITCLWKRVCRECVCVHLHLLNADLSVSIYGFQISAACDQAKPKQQQEIHREQTFCSIQSYV